MAIHDWSKFSSKIFHHIHQRWIGTIADALNQGFLQDPYYALTEQHGAGFEPDMLALRTEPTVETGSDFGFDPSADDHGSDNSTAANEGGNGVSLAEPRVRVRAETDLSFYRRKQNVVTVRHASGDRLVSVVEVVSKANKSGRKAFGDFIDKTIMLLEHRIHVLILDLQPPTSRDPNGIHGAVWEEIAGEEYVRPADKPLTLASYEASGGVRAFVEPVGVGDDLIGMPLFLALGRHVAVPLEETYRTAFASVPPRWRDVLDPRDRTDYLHIPKRYIKNLNYTQLFKVGPILDFRLLHQALADLG